MSRLTHNTATVTAETSNLLCAKRVPPQSCSGFSVLFFFLPESFPDAQGGMPTGNQLVITHVQP